MNLFRRIGGLSLFVAALVFGGPATSADAPGTSVRFCFNDWPPYASSVGGEAIGISVDILREAASRAGLTAAFRERPWNRCLEEVRNGTLDAVIDAAARPDFLQGPVSFSRYTNTFWVRDDDPALGFDPSVLKGRIVGLVTGYVYPETLLELMRGRVGLIDYAVDDATNARKLALGRQDIIVADLVSTVIMRENEDLDIRPLLPSPSSNHLYPSFNRQRGELHRRINEALETMQEDGTFDRVYRRHLGRSPSEMGLSVTPPRDR